MKKYLAALFLLTSINLSASHLLGGEITWECRSNGKYQFTLVLYRDCGGITLPTTAQTLVNNAGVLISCSYVGTKDVLTSCYQGTTSCGGSPAGQGKIQKYIYRSGDVQLTGTPPAGGWYFSWSSCCRPATISNGPANQGYLIRSIIYPYTPSGSTTPLSASVCFDSSPEFLDNPMVVACTSTDAKMSQLTFDRDSDSLYFSFGQSLQGTSFPGNPVTYSTGYSPSSPLPASTGNTPATINGENGDITFNTTNAGNWTTCTKVEQWRCGQLVGEIFRDYTLTTLNCAPPSGLCGYTNSIPSVSLTPLNNSSITPILNNLNDTVGYSVYAGPGDSIAFKLSAIDPYPNPNCSSQNIFFSGSGPILSLGPTYQLDSTLTGASAAVVNSLNVGGAFSYPGINDVEIGLRIDSTHLDSTANMYCGDDWKKYPFKFRFSDDECPLPSYSDVYVEVFIDFSTPALPFHSGCINISNGFNELNWTPNLDTGRTWGFYLIESYDSIGYKITSDTIFNWSDSVFVDSINSSQAESYKLSLFNSYGISNGSNLTFNNTPLAPQLISATIDTSNNLLISWNNGNSHNEWFIFSYRDSSLNWHKLDSMQMSSPFSGVLNTSIPSSYIDTTIITAVKVDARDYCGNTSNTVSNNALNLLSLLVTNNDSIWRLTWTPYSDSVETTYSYQVYAKYPSSSNFSLIGTTTSNSFDITADTSINTLCFYIEVTEVGSSQVITRSNKECLTNIGINNIQIDEVHIFPNPTSGQIVIKISENLRASSYVLEGFDNVGRLVYRKLLINGYNVLDLGGSLAKGYYVLVIKNDHSKVIQRKVIILQ